MESIPLNLTTQAPDGGTWPSRRSALGREITASDVFIESGQNHDHQCLHHVRPRKPGRAGYREQRVLLVRRAGDLLRPEAKGACCGIPAAQEGEVAEPSAAPSSCGCR